MRKVLRLSVAILPLLLSAGEALASCAGASGIPFNCTQAVINPQPTDIVLGGATTGTQTGQTVGFTFQQISNALVNAVNTNFASPPPIGSTTPNTGAFSQLMPGYISQAIATTWSGPSFPGTNNLASYSTQTYTGSPTASFGDTGGAEIPFNLQYISSDQIAWNPGGAAGVIGWDFVQRWGGGGTTGSRSAMQIDMAMLGAVPWFSGIGQVGLTIHTGAYANFSGAASGSGNGRGQEFTESLYWGALASGIFFHEVTAAEWDFVPQSGSSSDYVYGLKMSNAAPSGWVANIFQSMLTFGAVSGGGLSPHIITFGDPQEGANGFPGTSTGDLLYAFAGTTGTAIDFSAITATSLLKGPASFNIDGSAYVHSRGVIPATGNATGFFNASLGVILAATDVANSVNSLGVLDAATGNIPVIYSNGSDATVNLAFQTAAGNGNFYFYNAAAIREFEVAGVASPVSYGVMTPAASGNIQLDVGGNGTGISIGGAAATSVTIGSATADQVHGSGTFMATLSATAGFIHFPFTNASSGSGGIPTGTPANTQGPACEWNAVTFVLNCYDPGAAAWKHVQFSPNAG